MILAQENFSILQIFSAKVVKLGVFPVTTLLTVRSVILRTTTFLTTKDAIPVTQIMEITLTRQIRHANLVPPDALHASLIQCARLVTLRMDTFPTIMSAIYAIKALEITLILQH